MKTTQAKLATAISKYKKSTQLLLTIVAIPHLVIISLMFPMLTVTIMATFMLTGLMYAWCELIYQIENSQRSQLMFLIQTTTNEHTRQILRMELWEIEKHNGLSGTFDPYHII
jgi:glucan phosphoethanolaminetransferase (alkaline phosphatase superfamily)